MAITMSEANAETALDARSTYLSKSVDTGALGDEVQTEYNWFVPAGANLAGVTADLVTNYTKAVETYSDNVKEKINELSNPKVNSAFKGKQVEASLKKFVDSVKVVANSYLASLAAVQTAIAGAVAAAYEQQDTDLSGNLTTDTGTLEESVVEVPEGAATPSGTEE